MDALKSAGPWSAEIDGAVQRAERISQNEFCFLSHRHAFPGGNPDWHDPAVTQLWRYHLHYFDYVTDLLVWSARGSAQPALETFVRLVKSWLEANRSITGDGWHPYPLSLRLVNWLTAARVFGSSLTDSRFFRQEMGPALTSHARILGRDLEWDVRGNHLLKNLRAMVWATIVFRGSLLTPSFDRLLSYLQSEVEEQIDADGGHFERTPGYHLVILKDLIEIAVFLRRTANRSFDWLDSALRRMLDYLRRILPPNQEIPLLKDTAWDAAPEPGDLLTLGALYFDEPRYKIENKFGLLPLLLFGLEGWDKFQRWTTTRDPVKSGPLKAAGYFIFRNDLRRDYLILDAGKPCPDYLPAHAHADMFSYELTVAGRRVVVDSGVYEYRRGLWRDYFRSTRAHNTVEVGGENQSEVWNSFRVARRASPRNVLWCEHRDGIWFQAEHDGYCRYRPGAVHRRTVFWQKNGYWLFIDELLGEGPVCAGNHLHWHPSIELKDLRTGQWEICAGVASLWLTAFGYQESQIVKGRVEPAIQGWSSERFGEITPNSVLTLSTSRAMPFSFGYVISTGEAVELELSDAGLGNCKVTIRRDGRKTLVRTDATRPFEFL